MYKNNNSELTYSPSDLTRHINSPFASWMERFVIEFPDIAPAKDGDDEMQGMLATKGYAHEAEIEADFEGEGKQFVRIDASTSVAKLQETRDAMREGADVIAQGMLALPPFQGYSDFLVRVPGESSLGDYHYEVWDSKLSNNVKPSFVIQLCCYAEMLQSIQGMLPANITVVKGDKSRESLKTVDYFHYYLSVKTQFLAAQQNFDASQRPDPTDSRDYGNWNDVAQAIIEAEDKLIQVANISRSQIKKLAAVGVHTVAELVDCNLDSVKGINDGVFQRLKAQAAIQQKSRGLAVPLYELIPQDGVVVEGLSLLPPHSPLDIFFDIEGYPLVEGGLEYLWGASYFDEEGERQFIDFWAHNHQQEKLSFHAFIQWAYSRWQADPSMHIYHYANYEIAACRRLMGRYGVCEEEVDQLLRNNVFVDLYKVVRGGIRIGEPSYSIKNVEHLYRQARQTDVGSGGDSIVVYEHWRDAFAAGEDSEDWQQSSTLQGIRDYNIDDCDSTQELVDWLRLRQEDAGISYVGNSEVYEPEISEEVTAKTQLRDRMLAKAEVLLDADPTAASITENLAWALEFHRREAKPVFWKMFERLGQTDDELYDDLECIAGCRRTQVEPYKPPRAQLEVYEYQFDTTQEIKGKAGSYYVLGLETEEGKSVSVSIHADATDLEVGAIGLKSREPLPDTVTLVPNDFVRPDPIPQALHAVVAEYDKGNLERSAIVDFLTRAKPRIKGHKGGPIVTSGDPDLRMEEVISAVVNLDNSCLTIQGPPGAGKTFTAKKIIARLMQDGAVVGVSSNSHKAINNLLISAAESCADAAIEATFCCTKKTDDEINELGIVVAKNASLADLATPSTTIGTTAWGFSRDDMEGQLDYLFIDEAGQVSIANLIAMSRSAKNIVLLGDQMQLGQPSQATHPAESGLSVLDYLLHDKATIEADEGVFLGTTYRMHPAVNGFISTYIYDGKLQSAPVTESRVVEVPKDYSGVLNKEAGIVFVPVEHQGNTQASDEEVDEICSITNELLTRQFSDGGKRRKIGWKDILFVAPYNHQVTKLKAALGDNARVGSVDKFQGQEAPIVILSMCASDANESPRGIDFLFDKHRLNVAISRAQSLAIVVASPTLAEVNVGRVAQMKQANLFCALRSAG